MRKFEGLVILLLISAVASIRIGSTHNMIHDYCWKDSYGRGVGTVPSNCGSKYQKIGLLCYDPCPSGYTRFVIDCHQNCPAGFTDQGLFCRLSEYGRGAGYPWKFGDGFKSDGMFQRCQKENGAGNCQKYGLIVYPKCKAGYHNTGCCICRPQVPNCRGIGMNGGIDLSCTKYIKVGTPHFAQCPSNKQYDAGLCYNPCKKGFYGVGPVCWMDTPGKWVSCGMAAAKSTAVCTSTIISEVSSVGQLAYNIAVQVGTLGAATPVVQTSNAAKAASQLATLKKKFDQLKKIYDSSPKIKQVVNAAINYKGQSNEGVKKSIAAVSGAEEVKTVDTTKVTAADIARISAQIAALVDPIGVAGVVQSFSHPKCTDIIDEINNPPKSTA